MFLANVTVNTIESNGLLMKKLGNAFTYEKSINLIISTPIQDYMHQQQFIEFCIGELSNMQNHSYYKNGFENVMFELRNIMNTINEMNGIVKDLSKRDKRALFPIVGEIYEYFFGSASEKTVKEIWDQLDEENEKHLLISAALFNQSGHATATINAIQQKNNYIDTKIMNIIEKLNDVIIKDEENTDKVTKREKINNLIQILTLAILRYKSYQDKLMSHLINQEFTHIDPEIVPFTYLHSMLDEVELNENVSDNLPWKLFDETEFMNWYQMIPMKISVIAEYIIIEINIPLISIEKKEIYEAIAVPVPMENILMYIQSETPYFITNSPRNEIGFLSV